MKVILSIKLAFIFAAFVSFCCTSTSTPSGNNIFTPTALYFLANSGGNDGSNGLTTGAAWSTPNHAVNCGDVVLVQPGTYTGKFFQNFGAVSNCPSSSGGIDGLGQIYAATLLCAVPLTCFSDEIWMNKSNWAVSGFVVQDFSASNTVGIRASPTVTGNLSYNAIINSVCTGASIHCFYGGPQGGLASTNSIDEFALIGLIAFGASGTNSVCGSGFSINNPSNVDSLAGTHIMGIGLYAYANINGLGGGNCGPTGGNFPTANGAVLAGATTVTASTTSGYTAGFPIAVINSSGIAIAGIPQPNWITNIAGSVLTLNSAVTAPGISNGAQMSVGLSTDGEGIILDTWGGNPYTKQAYFANSLLWANGGHGFEIFCGSTNCQSALTVIVDHITTYGNLQDYKHSGLGGEFNYNLSTTGLTFTYTNNINQASVITPFQSPSIYQNVPTTGFGMGNPVVGAILNPGATISGNFFKSAAGPPTCPAPNCTGTGNDAANFNGANYSSGNTFGTDAGFANVAALPSTAPSCSGSDVNVYNCIVRLGAVGALTPSGGAASKGHQPPGACGANTNYATWTKGLNYQVASGYANGATITENYGLTSRPCVM